MIRFTFRATLVLGSILGFMILAAGRETFMALSGFNELRRRAIRTRAISAWSRFLMKRLGIEVTIRQLPRLARQGSLLVSNHLSFWDVLAIASETSAVFVTSVEVRDTPVLGWLCRSAGCIFVERRSRARSTEERAEVARALRDGFSVVLFPEATSTDGSGVLPFKRSFFTSAIAAGSPVIPICINYREIDGEPVTVKNRDRVFYYGDHEFFAQLAHAFRFRSVQIEIDVLEAIETSQDTTDREWLTSEAYRAVVSRYVPLVST